MVFRHFRAVTVTRVILITITVLLLAFMVYSRFAAASIFAVSAILIYQVYALVKYVEKTNRDLRRFLSSIEYSDFTQSFSSKGMGKSFEDLTRSFSLVLKRFRDISFEKEESYRYLQAIVQHIGIGILAFREDGEVELLNNAAKRLLGISHLKNVQNLSAVSELLEKRIRELKPGQRDLVTIKVNDELLQLSIYVSNIVKRQGAVTLASLQNISMELNEKEMDAWQNLIRVLTHEIKNSLTPIASLTSSVEGLLLPDGKEQETTAPCEAGDIRGALQTIQRRCHGLLQFVDTYRDLTHIPKPVYGTFAVADLIERVEKLVFSDDRIKKPELSISIEPQSLQLTADQELVEQVLINLLLNSVQAAGSAESAKIEIEAFIDERSRAAIRVSDNGPGIVPDALEKIFVPFYSTKKDGSGIGLSLSRQIMRLHRGDLTAQSEPGVRTSFTMRF